MLLTTDAVGGVWRYSIDLARGLTDRGTPVVLAVLGPAPGPAQHAEAQGLNLVQTGLDLDWTAPNPAALTHAGERLATLAALTGATSVHLHAPALLGTAKWPAPVVAVTHSCLGTWWHAVRGGTPPDDFAWRIAATKAGLHQATAVIAPSAAHAAATRAIYGNLEITVIHNGAALPPLPPARQGRGEGPVPILTAGRLWDEAKNLAAIDVAAATLPIAAAGPVQGPNGERIALPNLHLLGTLDPAAMHQAYANARVFVSMAHYEPFGLSVLEAANAGLRLVLSDIPTFRELWDGAATFAAPHELADVLRQALENSGDGGARDRAARYSIDHVVEATIAVHAKVLAGALA